MRYFYRMSQPGIRASIALVAIALVSVLANGYWFGISDHNEQLVIIKHLLDKSFLERDWFVNWNDGLQVRLFYSFILGALSIPLGGLESAFLVVYVIALVALCLAVYLMARAIWNVPTVGLVAVVIVLYNRLGSLGSSQLVVPILVPSFLAYSLIILCAYGLFRKWYVLSAFGLVLAGLVHPLIGLNSTIILGLARFFSLDQKERRRAWRQWLLLGSVAGLIALLGWLSTSTSTPVDRVELIRIIAWVRGPWHYLPFTWDQGIWLDFAAFLLLATMAWFCVPRSAFLDWIVICVIGFGLLGILAPAWQPIWIAIELQPFRMTVILQLVGALYLARYCWEMWCAPDASRRLAGWVLLAGLSLLTVLGSGFFHWLVVAVLISEIVRSTADRVVALHRWKWISVMPILGLVLGGGLYLLFDTEAGWPYFVVLVSLTLVLILLTNELLISEVRQREWVLVSMIAVLFSLVSFAFGWTNTRLPGALSFVTSTLHMHLEFEGDFDELASWARINTPHDAIFIAPPYLESFRLRAERAIVVDFKSFPFKDIAILEWRQRINDLSGGESLSLGNNYRSQLATSYDNLSAEQFVQLAVKYNAKYVITRHSLSTSRFLHTVYTNGTYYVTEIVIPEDWATSSADVPTSYLAHHEPCCQS